MRINDNNRAFLLNIMGYKVFEQPAFTCTLHTKYVHTRITEFVGQEQGVNGFRVITDWIVSGHQTGMFICAYGCFIGFGYGWHLVYSSTLSCRGDGTKIPCVPLLVCGGDVITCAAASRSFLASSRMCESRLRMAHNQPKKITKAANEAIMKG